MHIQQTLIILWLTNFILILGAEKPASYFQVYDPFNNKKIKSIRLSTHTHLEKKLARAFATFKNIDKRLSIKKRITILENFLNLLSKKKNRKALIKMAIEEGGKPLRYTRSELDRAIESTKITISTLRQLRGKEVALGATENSINRRAFTYREPIGVVLAISAFNHPINLAIHQILPAIAAGCPVLFKPAKKTPSCGLFIQQLLYKAGLPKGYCQVIHCNHTQTKQLLKDPRVRHLSFIGSAKVGWQFRSCLAPGTTCTLEHGGTASVIVTEETNLTTTIDAIVQGAFYHSGQVCVSVQKVWVQEAILDRFLAILLEKTRKLKIGDPRDEATEIGPVISPKSLQRINFIVQDAIKKGGKLLLGGKKVKPTIYQPTVLLAPPLNSQAAQEEIFGPVVIIYPYKELSQAVEEANTTPFSFQAAIFSQQLQKILYTIKRLEATTVMVNDHTAFREDGMPFGGRKISGMGVGGIPGSIKALWVEKLIVLKDPELI